MSYIHHIPRVTNPYLLNNSNPHLELLRQRDNNNKKRLTRTLAQRDPHQSSFTRLPKLINEGHNLITPFIDRLIQQQVQQNKRTKAGLQEISSVQKQVFIDIKRNDIQKRHFQIEEKKGKYQRQKQTLKNFRLVTPKNQSISRIPITNYYSDTNLHASGDSFDERKGSKQQNIKGNGVRKFNKSQSYSKIQRYLKPHHLEPIFQQTQRGRDKQQQLIEKVQLLNQQKQQLIRRINYQVENNRVLSHSISVIKSKKHKSQKQINTNSNLQRKVQFLTKKLIQIQDENIELKQILLSLDNKRTLYRNKSHQNFQFGFPLKSDNNINENQRRSISKKNVSITEFNVENIPNNRNRKLTSQGSKQRIPSIDDFDKHLQPYSNKYIECIPRNVESKYYRAEVGDNSFASQY